MSNEHNNRTAGDLLREAIHDAIAATLGDAYDCTRVWSAWSYGTMGQDDFSLITDDSDRMAELTDAVLAVIASQPAATVSEMETVAPVAVAPTLDAELAQDRMSELCELERDVLDSLPAVYYMDPPDGGDVSLGEQVKRMAEDAVLWRKHSSTPAAPGIGLAPRPMDSAPTDGTMVRLLVQFEDHATEDTEGPAWTIGACNDDNVGDDERVGWQFAGWCWDHDHFTEGKGMPVGWLPLIDASPKGGEPVATLTIGDAGEEGTQAYFLDRIRDTEAFGKLPPGTYQLAVCSLQATSAEVGS